MPDPAQLYLDLLKQALTASIYDESGWTVLNNFKIGDKLIPVPPEIALLRKTPLDVARREIGKDWPFFGYSMIGRKRLDNIQFCIDQILQNHVPGDFIETGVWRGGATIFMRAMLLVRSVADRNVWVADSFEGMPSKGEQDKSNTDPDLSKVKYLAVSLEQVQANFRRFGLLDDQVKFLKGWFKDSLPVAPIQQLALLRCDCDLYESTTDTLVHLYHKVSPGGYVIVDDYLDWQGCRQAVDAFRRDRNITAEIQVIDQNGIYWQVES